MMPRYSKLLVHCCFVLCILSIVKCQQYYHTTSDKQQYDIGEYRTHTGDRQKRAMSSYFVAKGLAAVKSLLTGITPVRTNSPNFRSYIKHGSFSVAKKDFYSVQPRNVKVFSGGLYGNYYKGEVWMGYVGDRRLRLSQKGIRGYSEGHPTLEIISVERPPAGPFIEKIIYK